MSAPSRATDPDRRIFGIGELLGGLRRLLEDRVGRVWVVGEISNLFEAASGHCYFTLKDDDGQIRAALFRNTARSLPFSLEEGLEVLVHAEVTIYEARGDLQLIVRHMEPRGAGALQLAFEQLRARLDAEGLFDEARKRRLPPMPRRIGVVTSPHGAAVRDVVRVSAQRFPGTPLLVSPTRVQGPGVEREIEVALARVAQQSEVDVVLLVRGGGSLEDLWAFNTESLVRAVAACPVPVVCGVGHEVDVTLCDLAADRRAATPSAAVLEVLPDAEALRARVARLERSLGLALRARMVQARGLLKSETDALRALAPAARLRAQAERLTRLERRLGRAMQRAAERRRDRVRKTAARLRPRALGIETRRDRLRPLVRGLQVATRRGAQRRRAELGALAGRLDSLSPLAVLGRGYGLVRRSDDRRVVRRAGDLREGERFEVQVAEARIEAAAERVTVEDWRPQTAADPDED